VLDVVGKQIAVQSERLVGHCELVSQERGETPHDRWIGVHELDGFARFRSLGPVEHASGNVHGVALASEGPPLHLIREPTRAEIGAPGAISRQFGPFD
jgi:hypothetical protein